MLQHSFVPTVQLNATYFLLLVGTVGTTITPYMQLFIQSSVAEKGVTMEHYGRAQRDVRWLDLRRASSSAPSSSPPARRSTPASGGQGVQINSADAGGAGARPVPGQVCAESLFGVGLLGASLLAAAVCHSRRPTRSASRSASSVASIFSFREAPIFQGLFTGMLALGALVALIPGLPLIQLIIVAQIINGMLLPILLVFILRLVNDRRIMGQYTNTLAKNIIAWGNGSDANWANCVDARQRDSAALRRTLLAIA